MLLNIISFADNEWVWYQQKEVWNCAIKSQHHHSAGNFYTVSVIFEFHSHHSTIKLFQTVVFFICCKFQFTFVHRRRLPVVMVRSLMAETLKAAVTFIEQGNIFFNR